MAYKYELNDADIENLEEEEAARGGGDQADDDNSPEWAGEASGGGPAHHVDTGDGFEIPAAVQAFLQADELSVIPVRLHWVQLLLPMAAFGGGLLAAIALNGWGYEAGWATGPVVHLIWITWVIGAAWAVYRWLTWRGTWFVITGYRIMLIRAAWTGRRHVDMLPLTKIRDLGYDQDAGGRVFRYATFTFASLGTGRALGCVRYIPEPEWMYQRLSELSMSEQDRKAIRRKKPAQ
jgi:Bacterial PH domain